MFTLLTGQYVYGESSPAKLIALDSDLSPPDVIELILKGADEVSEGDNVMRVIHPKRSAELATSSDKRASM